MRPLDNSLKRIGEFIGPVRLEFDPNELSLRWWACTVAPLSGGPVVEAVGATAGQAVRRVAKKLGVQV